MSDTTKATVKKRISPVTVTIELTFQKVNENGTFSMAEGKVVRQSVKGNDFFLSMPFKSGGAIYVKTNTLAGITVLEDAEGTDKPEQKKKLF